MRGLGFAPSSEASARLRGSSSEADRRQRQRRRRRRLPIVSLFRHQILLWASGEATTFRLFWDNLRARSNMTKDRRDRSVSSDRFRASPLRCSSSRPKRSFPKIPSESEENIKEWEDARCPVCMEHPHNAVLLICTSHDKGCRPYMCDTSYRHSNCLDQFRKSFTATSSAVPQQEMNLSVDANLSPAATSDATIVEAEEIIERPATVSLETQVLSDGPGTSSEKSAPPKLVCPLCRGQIKDWIIEQPARRFMNAKSRSCACETCDFMGSYRDLRKHARLEHPLVRPSEADPERQRNWRRMERQRDIGDLISTLQSSFSEDRSDEDAVLPMEDRGWLTVFFLIRVFQPSSRSRSSSWSTTSGTRARLTFRRRSTRLWGENYDADMSLSSSMDEDNDSSDGGSITRRRRERLRRRSTPNNQP